MSNSNFEVKVSYKTLSIVLLFSSYVWSHGGVDHSKKVMNKESENMLEAKPLEGAKYSAINKVYLSDIKPLFKKSCFDCHSDKSNYPWYYKLPGVKQLIDSDIKEARSHIDFSNDYPFLSHESPVNDLKSIKKSIEIGSMPPSKYRWLHPDSKLSKEEKAKISDWTRNSLLLLNKE